MPFKQTFILLFFALSSCKQKADFIISNENENKKSVDFIVTLGQDTIFNDTLRWTDVRPDLSNYFKKSFSKGKYVITIKGDSGKINIIQPIDLSEDSWIFVTYVGLKGIRQITNNSDKYKNNNDDYDTVIVHATREEPTFY